MIYNLLGFVCDVLLGISALFKFGLVGNSFLDRLITHLGIFKKECNTFATVTDCGKYLHVTYTIPVLYSTNLFSREIISETFCFTVVNKWDFIYR